MSIEIAVEKGLHRRRVGQEGGQIEDRGYAVVHHHLAEDEKH